MIDEIVMNVMQFVKAAFPPGRLESALGLALFSAWIVGGVCIYLCHHTHKPHFRIWTAAWLYYSLYLLGAICLETGSDLPVLLTLRRACLGVSAVCLLWGSVQLNGRLRHERELGVGLVIVLAWSCIAGFVLLERRWSAMPMLALLALASAYTGALLLRFRKCGSAFVLTAGFVLWSAHLLAVAFQDAERLPLAVSLMAGDSVAAGLLLGIALGMLMLGLEQARERNETLLAEFKKGVTQHRFLEQEISVSEQKYRALFDSAGDAILLVDLSNFEIVEANEATARIVGCEAADLAGSSLAKLCPQLGSAGSSLLENKKLVEDMLDATGEFYMKRAQGGQALCEGSANLVKYHKRPALQLSAREITERKRMEQQLRQTEKLTALGQLVAGVAHELNNPLAVVMGYAQILSQHKVPEDKARKDLLKILHESDRAAKIVRNLLTFARPREPHMVGVDVNRLVAEALETREIQLQGASVRVVRRLAPDLPLTMADPNQIEQVLANLVTNAMQALANHPGQHVIEATTEERNGKIRITIADNGPGIPPQILNKIYDPFFTTKGPGKGTGLGLSICYSIVEEHKGKIWAESELGKGSRFFVELPVVACAQQPDAYDPTGATSGHVVDPEASQRRLLIVDDEPGIVDVLKEVLGNGGYRVETACNGHEALARIASQSYDLIISDLCMPEMGGEKFYRVLSERFPHLVERIIFVTGDTVSPNSRRFLEETGVRWLSKPFNIREIERLVVDTLREEPTTVPVE